MYWTSSCRKIDGLTVMERCQSRCKCSRKAPAFIVVSAVGQERITEDAFSLGAEYYMLKPFDNQVLLNRIKNLRRRSDRRIRENVRPSVVREEPGAYEQETWRQMSQILSMRLVFRHISKVIST